MSTIWFLNVCCWFSISQDERVKVSESFYMVYNLCFIKKLVHVIDEFTQDLQLHSSIQRPKQAHESNSQHRL